MDTEGTFAPETVEEVRERYEDAGGTAQVLVRELARAMDFDEAEYEQRVTPEVVATAREALFAERLRVRVGTREEYEAWREDFDGDVAEFGSEHVERVAWHAPPVADRAVAATFQDEREAAVGTLRRQAVGELYEDLL